MPSARRSAAVPPLTVPAGLTPADRVLKPRQSDQSLLSDSRSRLTSNNTTTNRTISQSSYGHRKDSLTPVISISSIHKNTHGPSVTDAQTQEELAEELDYITIPALGADPASPPSPVSYRTDKASRILGIKHRKSMEPIPASARNSIVSTRSVRDVSSIPSFTPTLPLTSLYVVSGLPKSPHTWTLADPDSVMGLHHSEGAVNRWWRPEVLGSTVSPGAGGGKKKKRGKSDEMLKGAGSLSKQEVGKMLSKALKVCLISNILSSEHSDILASYPSLER
jgi:EEF1A N-terminal glycine/lysine methyltransferase